MSQTLIVNHKTRLVALLGHRVEHAEAVVDVRALVAVDLPSEHDRDLQLLVDVVGGRAVRQVAHRFAPRPHRAPTTAVRSVQLPQHAHHRRRTRACRVTFASHRAVVELRLRYTETWSSYVCVTPSRGR
eukprot:1939937-Pyramimonas_sp.AAC.1